MAEFSLYIPKLRKLEGGWSDDPCDPGGATMCGVTLNTYRCFYGQHRTKEELRNISEGEWRHIMKSYWDRCKADQIRNQSIAELFVDWHVNAGANAIRRVQRAFGLKADGIVGKATLGALNGENEKVVFDRVQSSRVSYYNKLVTTDPAKKKFLRGWLDRTYSFKFSISGSCNV